VPIRPQMTPPRRHHNPRVGGSSPSSGIFFSLQTVSFGSWPAPFDTAPVDGVASESYGRTVSDQSTELIEKIGRLGLRAIPVVLIFAAAIYASAQSGTPDELPGAALGWDVLFHVLRASALLGAAGVVLLVGWRAAHGDFPIKFGNVEYAVKEAADKAGRVSAAQERRLRYLEVLAGVRDPGDLEDDQPLP
jgi:hypothetical protein